MAEKKNRMVQQPKGIIRFGLVPEPGRQPRRQRARRQHHRAGSGRVATGAEREQLYQKFVDVYSTYGDYAKATTREIPVVVVDPA